MAVRFGVDLQPQMDARHDDVARSIIGEQGGIGGLWRISIIQPIHRQAGHSAGDGAVGVGHDGVVGTGIGWQDSVDGEAGGIA